METAHVAAAPSRTERRKQETRRKLADAALRVFLRRGYDATTTGEIAAEADLGAGTFYLHFKDKRDIYEALARRAAREMTARWRERMRPGTPLREMLALGLETAASYWAEDRERARLLLEGGPSFGSDAHLRLVHDVSELIAASARGGTRTDPSPEVVAAVALGLAIELGRMIVAGGPEAEVTVEGTIDLVRRTLFGPVRRR
jgi:AcrR family transcriptional regulator